MSGPNGMRDLTCDEVREMAGAYVLGALEAVEAAAVRKHLATCGEAHEEIAELGSVVPALFEIVPIVEPPAGLKARIMAAAAADLAVRSATLAAEVAPADLSGVVASLSPPIAFPGAREPAPPRAGTSPGPWVLRIAAVLAIALLGGWNLLLQNDLGAARQYEQAVAAVLDAAARPGSVTAVLTADGGTGSGLAAVAADGVLAMAMRNLEPNAGGSVYEAWVIAADGVPVPLGSFVVGSSGTAFFRASGLPATDGIVLALTREPGTGATAPTLPIISKGIAAAPG